MKAEITSSNKELTIVRWSDPKLGFGEIRFEYNGSGGYTIDAEYMFFETVIKIIQAIEK